MARKKTTASKSKSNAPTDSKKDKQTASSASAATVAGHSSEPRRGRKRAIVCPVGCVPDPASFIRNVDGRLVSKARSAAAKGNKWAQSVSEARKKLGETGFVPVKRGTPLYNETVRIMKAKDPAFKQKIEQRTRLAEASKRSPGKKTKTKTGK